MYVLQLPHRNLATLTHRRGERGVVVETDRDLMLEVTTEFLREALEKIATAVGVPIDADYGPKPNGLLLEDILLAATRERQEWAVTNDLGKVSLWARFATRPEAEKHLRWLVEERRPQLQHEAEENEASGFESGNGAWYRWHVDSNVLGGKDGGEKARTYCLVTRTITPWVRVDD
jgi:hypothetical protein